MVELVGSSRTMSKHCIWKRSRLAHEFGVSLAHDTTSRLPDAPSAPRLSDKWVLIDWLLPRLHPAAQHYRPLFNSHLPACVAVCRPDLRLHQISTQERPLSSLSTSRRVVFGIRPLSTHFSSSCSEPTLRPSNISQRVA